MGRTPNTIPPQADMSPEFRCSFLRENSHFLAPTHVHALIRREPVDLDDPSALLGSRRLAVGLRDDFRREIVCVGYKKNLKTFRSTP
jgi:hypothetical protein